MKKKKRIFAGAPSEQAKQTKKEVLSGKCLRTQHNKADRQTKLFKAADGIIAALKKRSALPVHANNPRAAFTLAEVLITLTIIGVVAAITIPTLAQKTNKQEYVTALQKAYSVLSQATNMIIAEEGSPKSSEGGWASSPQAVYEIYRQYLNILKDCGTSAGCFSQHSGTNGYYYLNKSSGRDASNWNSQNLFKLITADGVQMMFSNEGFGSGAESCSYGQDGACAVIYVDVNGEKNPNTYGRDVFKLDLRENGLYPSGCSIDNCTGANCACQVIRERKMDY